MQLKQFFAERKKMSENQPQRVTLLLAYVFAGLLLISFALPAQFQLVEDQTLQVPNLWALFFSEKQKTQYADISEIEQKYQKKPQKTENKEKSTKKNTIVVEEKIKIQYPHQKDTALYAFFRALQWVDFQKGAIRVLHYGDSQLEGDRMTASIRAKFQEEFGGCGVGWVSVVNQPAKITLQQKSSDNWVKTAIYGNTYRKSVKGLFGLLGNFYTYKGNSASINIGISPFATHDLQRKAESLKVFYRNPRQNAELNIVSQGKTYSQPLNKSNQFEWVAFDLEGNYHQLSLQFKGKNSPEIYGFALDCNDGIAFDNIPLRGSSGVEFSRIQRVYFTEQLEKMDVKMIILQFGVNIVPYIQDNYDDYEEQFYQELKYLKSLSPSVSVLVVGVSDVSRKVGNRYESYPNIEAIRDAQKSAAFRAGCAFWDLYEAMGGKNSMPSWVFAKPESLANKDFIHFTNKGADIVAEMLYSALIEEYDKFLTQEGISQKR
ncbi:MAG: hypothetical protein EAZ55_08120 [Cytophagales bacterium]|nr:MAG: hypothetical protein EAZ55_08120 [Cytophagales bacterium]